MDILIGNLIFWPLWIGVSMIPYIMTQYAIDNYEELLEWKRQLS